jgi:cobalt-zinc-cadmium efflux system membrane fusion protein
VVFVVLNAFERDLWDESAKETRFGFRARKPSGSADSKGSSRSIELDGRDARRAPFKVEVRVENADELLRPGQFVTARINVRGEVRQAIAVPRSAIVLLEGQPTVFVEVEPGLFEPRPVGLEAGDSERVELTRGVREGESVAIEGVFALKSELQR